MPRRTDIRLVFQRRLKETRLSRQFSQKELGVKAGLDQFVASTRVNRYELGVHEPDLATIQRLALALSIPASYLFAEDDRLAKMIMAFDRLPAVERERVFKMVDELS